MNYRPLFSADFFCAKMAPKVSNGVIVGGIFKSSNLGCSSFSLFIILLKIAPLEPCAAKLRQIFDFNGAQILFIC